MFSTGTDCRLCNTAWIAGDLCITMGSPIKELLARIKQLDEGAPARVFNIRFLPDGRCFYKKTLASED